MLVDAAKLHLTFAFFPALGITFSRLTNEKTDEINQSDKSLLCCSWRAQCLDMRMLKGAFLSSLIILVWTQNILSVFMCGQKTCFVFIVRFPFSNLSGIV